MSFEQIKELGPLLARIDGLQAEVDAAKAAEPDAYARIMDSWAIESTYNTNNIEGSTLSLGDTALLYDGVQIDGPPTTSAKPRAVSPPCASCGKQWKRETSSARASSGARTS